VKKISLLTNENGSVIVLALIMLVLLTLLGMAVTRTTSIEVQIAANDSRAADNLYKAESADHYAIELINTWMTNTFLTTAAATANAVSPDLDNDGTNETNTDIDGDGISDFLMEIRCIEGGNNDIASLSDAANDLPVMQHISIPPVDSKSSLGKYIIRRYGITGTASNGCSVVQVGAYKIFNNFN
jgi:Tfp pilus assembly protein PilX